MHVSYDSSGDILESNCDMLVNPVNCKGTMGKGLALKFSEKFPEIVSPYIVACHRKRLQPGTVHICGVKKTKDDMRERYIANFPTKDDWKEGSQLIFIELGLKDLFRVAEILGVNSIAIPMLGCGLGGLDWKDVHKVILDEVERNAEKTLQVVLHAPDPSVKRRRTAAAAKA